MFSSVFRDERFVRNFILIGRRLALAGGVSLLFVASVHAQEIADPSLPETIDLSPVVVTANRTPTDERAVGSAVTLIDRKDLEDRQVRVVSDILRTVPGVAVSRSGVTGNQTQLRLRGSEANQTLVLIDGIEVNDPAAGSEFDFAHLLAQDIERIEVLRGPQSALYGSDAIGGVVNIVTRSGQGAPKVSGFLEGGSRGYASGAASIGGSGPGFDTFVSIGGLRTDGFWSASEARGNAEKDGYRNVTGFAKLGIEPSDILRIDLVGRITDYENEYDDFIGGAGAIDGDAGSKGKQYFGRAQARLDLFDEHWRQTVGLTGTRFDTDNLAGEVVTSRSLGEKTKVDYQSDVSFTTDGLFAADHLVTLLVEREEDSIRNDSAFSALDRSIAQTGFAGQYGLGIEDRVFLTASFRHDDNELFGNADTYRFTAAYDLFETGTKFRASYGTGVKNPTLFELFGYANNYRGNPDLDPERARGWDAGVDQWLLPDLLLMQATYFEQRIDDLITGAGQSSVNLPGTSTIRGVELAGKAYPAEGLTVGASYTYLHGRDADGLELVRRPSNTASLTINYTFLDDRANLNLAVTYNGEQKDLAFDPFYNQSVVDLDAYTLVDLAGAYKLNDTAELYGRVANLFDEEYEDVYTYGGEGRTIVGGLRASF